MTARRHFLDLDAFEPDTLRDILNLATEFKEGLRARHSDDSAHPLSGQTVAMIFELQSTRTRVSFDLAVRQLGGETVLLNGQDLQLGRGESVADTARALSCYVDGIIVRAHRHAVLLEFAEYSGVPVINGLTDRTHPCQLMADIMTFEAHCGPIAGREVAWIGDGNNVAASWIHAAVKFGFELRLACPGALRPLEPVLAWAAAEGGRVSVMSDPAQAASGADCVVTDTWVSMGDRDGPDRRRLLAGYQVDGRLMGRARPNAIFMHCLPAHRGEEVTAEVIDGPRSVVWDEVENRLHAQKGILAWCLG